MVENPAEVEQLSSETDTGRRGTDRGDLLGGLLRGPSGTLLIEHLDRRWPESRERLPTMARYALMPPGKLVRGLLTLLAAEASGGDARAAERVLPAALGMEYLHVATLVHDDVIDGDQQRRGRPTVAAVFGTPDAIVTGDHLLFSAFGAIADCVALGVDGEQVVAAVATLVEAGSDLCRGQVLEAQVAGDPDSGVELYLEVARLKTGALFRAVCQVGALLGGGDPARAAALAAYGERLGIAFQIGDDLLAYLPGPARAGKPRGSDLANARPTLPILLAHRDAPPARRVALTAALLAGRGDAEHLARVRGLLEASGALDGARRAGAEHAERAVDRLAELVPSTARDHLASIARWTVAREC